MCTIPREYVREKITSLTISAALSRFQQIESRWGYSGTSDKIRFLVDRRIFVVGFGLYGSIHGPSEYQATIQVEIVWIHKAFRVVIK